MAEDSLIRVLVVDDHPVVRGGVEFLVADSPDITVVGSVSTGQAAVREVQRIRPDLVLLDLRLPDVPAPELLARLRRASPDVRIVIFTAYADHGAIELLMEAGADGCLIKDVGGIDLASAVRRVILGIKVIDPRLAERSDLLPADLLFRLGLTRREYEVLRLAAMGQSNPEIAEELRLARNTVKSYLQSAMRKLSARNRVEAIAKAHELRLL